MDMDSAAEMMVNFHGDNIENEYWENRAEPGDVEISVAELVQLESHLINSRFVVVPGGQHGDGRLFDISSQSMADWSIIHTAVEAGELDASSILDAGHAGHAAEIEKQLPHIAKRLAENIRKVKRNDFQQKASMKTKPGRSKVEVPYGQWDLIGSPEQQQLERALWSCYVTRHTDGPDAKPNMMDLAKTTGVPRSTLKRYDKRMVDAGWSPDMPELYHRLTGANIDPGIEEWAVRIFKWGDLSEVKSQFTEDEACALLLSLLVDNDMEIPAYWKDHGGPSPGWWGHFYRRHPELTVGKANRLAEVRIAASTPAAITAFGEKVMTDSEEGWFGLTPTGMEEMLRTNYPHTIEGWSDERIKQRAYNLCHHPKLQCCFDQKGHALGGSEVKVISLKYSRRQCRDVTDNTWCSVCPLVNVAGELLFNSFVIKGEHFEVDPMLGEALYGEDTILAGTATGYSSAKINLEQWKRGIAQLKRDQPWMFPMLCWVDGWGGHIDMEFRKWCNEQGIILFCFKSHSTVWACQLDNGAFGEYEKVYNKEIQKMKNGTSDWRDSKGMPMPVIRRSHKLPLLAAAAAVKIACDHAFVPKFLRHGAFRTIWKEKDAAGVAPEMVFLDGAEEGSTASVGHRAIEFTVATAHNYACEQIDSSTAQKVSGEGKTEKQKSTAQRKVDRRTSVVADKIKCGEQVFKAMGHKYKGVRGAAVERDANDNYVCYYCREHQENLVRRNATRKFNGGCLTLQEDFLKDKAKKESEAEVQEALQGRKDDRATKKQKLESEKEKKARATNEIVSLFDRPMSLTESGTLRIELKLGALVEAEQKITAEQRPMYRRGASDQITAAKDKIAELTAAMKNLGGDEKALMKKEKHREAVQKHVQNMVDMMRSSGMLSAPPTPAVLKKFTAAAEKYVSEKMAKSF